MHPVTIDEFRIATAETFDVIVEPSGQDAFTIFAQAMDRTAFAAGTLAVATGCARRCRRWIRGRCSAWPTWATTWARMRATTWPA